MKHLINRYNKGIMPVLLAAALSACSPSEEPGVKAKAVVENAKPATPKEAKAVPVAHTPAPAAKAITIQINNPQPAFSEADQARLKQEVGELEAPMKEVIEEYDRNLDNPKEKHRLESKMRKDMDAYNQKVLSLVKEELKQNPTPAN
jgi:hypothetical protein